MKNRILLITGGLVLFIFLVFGTYTWYLYFLEAGNNYAIDPDNTINSNLQDGKITEQGNHDELMKKNGIYAHLYNN